MMKKEFEAILGETVSDEDYKKIELVYTFYDEKISKEGITNLYRIGGMDLINTMVRKSKANQEIEMLENQRKNIQNAIQNLQYQMFMLHDDDMKLKNRIEELRKV